MDTRNNGWIQETTDGYKKQRMDTRNNGWIQETTDGYKLEHIYKSDVLKKFLLFGFKVILLFCYFC